jgi:hypothetical protein
MYLISQDDVKRAEVMIRQEYREMPGLRLTAAQAKRLWNLDDAICARALDRLVARRLLRRTRRGEYVRVRTY